MRIAELLNTFDVGGAERMAVHLATQLQATSHDVCAITLRGRGALAPVLESAGIEVVGFEKGDGFSPGVLRKIARFLRERRIDVVHTHNPLVNHYGALAAGLAGVPVVVSTVHGIGNLQGLGSQELIYSVSCLATDRIVAVCRNAMETFRQRRILPGRKLTYIYNGIPLDGFLSLQPDRTSKLFRFGTVGRLVPVKDHFSLLKAFREVVDKQPHCRLEILGNGPLEGELRQFAHELDLTDVVQFRGWSLDVAGFLSELDAFVFSSKSEGLPMAILEAMAAGLPVVATEVGGIPELVTDGERGWLAPPSRPDLLAQAMIEVATARELREVALRGRDFVVRHCSVERMTESYEALFLELLG